MWKYYGMMDIMWIRQELAAAGKTQADLAAAMGLTSVQVNKILMGNRKLTAEEADKVRAFFGIPNTVPMRVENGDAPKEHAKMVPVYDVMASAGHGAQNGYEAVAYSLSFPPSYLAKLTRSHPRNLAIISVKGDSMVPTLMDDDVVMIDTSKKNVDFDGLFVFRFGDALHIKRVTRAAKPGRIVAISDNRQHYDPIEYEAEDIQVVGRVIWYGRKV